MPRPDSFLAEDERELSSWIEAVSVYYTGQSDEDGVSYSFPDTAADLNGWIHTLSLAYIQLILGEKAQDFLPPLPDGTVDKARALLNDIKKQADVMVKNTNQLLGEVNGRKNEENNRGDGGSGAEDKLPKEHSHAKGDEGSKDSETTSSN